MSHEQEDCGCSGGPSVEHVAPSGGLGSCESGLCTPHGFQNAGIIDVTGRVVRTDGTPSAVNMNPYATGGAGPNGVQVFTKGSAALRPSGCGMPASPATFAPSHGSPEALPQGSDDYLKIDIKRDGDVEVIHASGQAAEDIAFAMDLSGLSDEQINDSIQKAQLQVQRAVDGMTEIGPVDDAARLLFTLERERARRMATAPHPAVAHQGGFVKFIETAGAVPGASGLVTSADAAWGYGASGQAAGGSSTGTSTGTGSNAQVTTTGATSKTDADPTTESRPDPAVVAAIGQGTTALIALLNSRLAAGDTERREQRLQEFQLELERIRRESGGSITTDQNAAITAAMAALAQQQQALAAERAAAAAEQEKKKSSMMMMFAVIAIVVALAGVAWYWTSKRKPEGGTRSNPSRGHGGMNPYKQYVERANRAAAAAAR